jgi:hypothetical protein
MFGRPRGCKGVASEGEHFPIRNDQLSVWPGVVNAGRLPDVAALNEVAKGICNKLRVKPIEYFIFRFAHKIGHAGKTTE